MTVSIPRGSKQSHKQDAQRVRASVAPVGWRTVADRGAEGHVDDLEGPRVRQARVRQRVFSGHSNGGQLSLAEVEVDRFRRMRGGRRRRSRWDADSLEEHRPGVDHGGREEPEKPRRSRGRRPPGQGLGLAHAGHTRGHLRARCPARFARNGSVEGSSVAGRAETGEHVQRREGAILVVHEEVAQGDDANWPVFF